MPNVGPLREWQLLKAAVLRQCREAEVEIEEELLQLHWRAILIVLRCPPRGGGDSVGPTPQPPPPSPSGRVAKRPRYRGLVPTPRPSGLQGGGGGAFLRRTTAWGFCITAPFFRWPKILGKSRVFT